MSNEGHFRDVVKATFLVVKKPGLSDEDFRNHYIHNHFPMGLEVCRRHGVIDYSVQLSTAAEKAEAAAFFGDLANSIDCDAITTFVFPDMKSLAAAFADPEYAARLVPDEERFTDRTRSRMAVGRELVAVRS